jgi:thiamine-phosphate pyrophosphorylase
MADKLLARRLHLLQGRLYGILDLGYVAPERLVETGRAMIDGGVDIVQLRAKGRPAEEILHLARELKPLFGRQDALFIVNDHPEVAKEVDADGVHIGQDDGLVPDVRRQLLPDQLVGKSTHSVEQAAAAEKEGADYIGVGPLFATPTKPDYVPVGLPLIAQVRQRVHIPQFCIGGIKRENLKEVLAAGATRAVVVSGILQAGTPEQITDYCRTLKAAIAAKHLLV